MCSDRGIAAHVPDLGKASEKRQQRRGRITDKEFVYDTASDSYQCPAGERLTRKSFREKRQSIDYAVKNGACSQCPLKHQCTDNAKGRTIKRHPRQMALDRMRARSETRVAKVDIRLRQHLMERSFATGQRYGIGRSRWRGLWRVQIQEYLTATLQNMDKLVRYGRYREPRGLMAMASPRPRQLDAGCIPFQSAVSHSSLSVCVCGREDGQRQRQFRSTHDGFCPRRRPVELLLRFLTHHRNGERDASQEWLWATAR